MKTRFRAALAGLGLILMAAPLLAVVTEEPHADAFATPGADGPDDWRAKAAYFVELEDSPSIPIYAQALENARSRNIAEAQALALANEAAQRQSAVLRERQAELVATMRAIGFGEPELYRLQRTLNGVAITLDGAQVEAARKLTGVKRVARIAPAYPMNSRNVPFVHVPDVWVSGAGLHGENIKIGIIDTGIDYLHTDFGGSGLPADYSANNTTTLQGNEFLGRVKGGVDLVGDAYNGSNSATPDPDPMDCGGHGSHVAGTAAGSGVQSNGATFTGPYDGTVPFASLRIGPGVAPKADIYAIRIFGCTGSTNFVAEGIEWAVDPNGDSNFSDHLDVVNASLGSDYGRPTDISTEAFNTAVLAGVTVVVSAGNSGDSYYVVGSPGIAERAISVASSVGPMNFITLHTNSPAPAVADRPASASEFGNSVGAGVTGDLALGSPLLGCSTVAGVSGKIALLDRGTCSFDLKVKSAQDGGAIAAIVINNLDGSPRTMTAGAPPQNPTIPSVMISKADGDILKTQMLSGTLNVTISPTVFNSALYQDTLSDFTSRGPGRNNRLKPEIAAPGHGIESVKALSGTLAANMSGTSMASPMVAGAMALLKQMHPTWSPLELKALAINTANTSLYSNTSLTPPIYGLTRSGSGRLRLDATIDQPIVAYDANSIGNVGLDFGSIEASGVQTFDKSIRVKNFSGAPHTFQLSYLAVTDAAGAAISFPAGASLSVPANGTSDFTVRLTVNSQALKADRDATIESTMGGVARYSMPEESGHVILSQLSRPSGEDGEARPEPEGTFQALRVPVLAMPQPGDKMQVAPANLILGNPIGEQRFDFTGTQIHTGSSFPTDWIGLAYPLQLGANAANDPSTSGILDHGDVKNVGVGVFARNGSDQTFDIANQTVVFGMQTYGDWKTPNEVQVVFQIDADENGSADYNVFTNPASTSTDTFSVWRQIVSPSSSARMGFQNGVSPSSLNTNMFNTNVVVMPVDATQIGLNSVNTSFNYRAYVFSREDFFSSIPTAYRQFDVAAPGATLEVAGSHVDPESDPLPSAFLLNALNNLNFRIDYRRSNFQSTGALGLATFFLHNGNGDSVQVSPVAQNGAAGWQKFE